LFAHVGAVEPAGGVGDAGFFAEFHGEGPDEAGVFVDATHPVVKVAGFDVGGVVADFFEDESAGDLVESADVVEFFEGGLAASLSLMGMMGGRGVMALGTAFPDLGIWRGYSMSHAKSFMFLIMIMGENSRFGNGPRQGLFMGV
jgi:hypothetical protein